MCIIAYKPEYTPMPEIEYLLNCQESNPDGDGYMIRIDGDVVVKKGFFDTYRMVDNIYADCDEKPEKYDIGIHYRWSTHGLTDRGNCHPFAISKKTDVLRTLECITSRAMMHNGIINDMKPSKILSDTQMFIKGNTKQLKWNPEKILNKTDGKFLYFSSDKVYMKGLFKDMGCYWSNSSYLVNNYGMFTDTKDMFDEKCFNDIYDDISADEMGDSYLMYLEDKYADMHDDIAPFWRDD